MAVDCKWLLLILLFNADDDGDDDHDYRGDCGYHDCDDDDNI